MGNMRFSWDTGTYTMIDNPSTYQNEIIELKNDERADDGSLISHHKDSYNSFLLDFEYIGTAQMMQFKTIFETYKSFDFAPMDEVRGTNLHYTVKWMNNFNPRFKTGNWQSGFNLAIMLEEV